MPIIYTQAGSDGVVIGDYTYRVTPLMRTYYPNIEEVHRGQGRQVASGIIYTEATPTLQDIGEPDPPGDGGGARASRSPPAIGTRPRRRTSAAPISQVLDANPDVVSILLVGASNPTAMTQLRQAGYDGAGARQLGRQRGQPQARRRRRRRHGLGRRLQLPAAGRASSQEFVKEYKDEYGEAPAQLRRRGLRRGLVPGQGRSRRPAAPTGTAIKDAHGDSRGRRVRRCARRRPDVRGPRPARSRRRRRVGRHRARSSSTRAPASDPTRRPPLIEAVGRRPTSRPTAAHVPHHHDRPAPTGWRGHDAGLI